MNLFFRAHLIWSLIFVVATFLITKSGPAIVAYGIGSLLILSNIGVLAFVLNRMFTKKSVALTVFSIVSKYAVLGIIIYLMTVQTYLPLVWFVVGLSTVVVSAVTFGAVVMIKKAKTI